MKVIIVGGIAAGGAAAARLRRLDETAEIIIFERSKYVSFANCGMPFHIGGEIESRDKLILQTEKSFENKFNLDIRTQHEVVSIDRAKKTVQVKDLATGESFEESYDKLLLSVGAKPRDLGVEGLSGPRVHSLRLLEDMDEIIKSVASADHVAVIGAGMIGIELVEALRRLDKQVTLIERAPSVVPVLDFEMGGLLETALEQGGVSTHIGQSVVKAEETANGLTLTLEYGATVDVQACIVSVGVVPDSKLAKDAGLKLNANGSIVVDEHMLTSDPDIYAAGDVVETMHLTTHKPTSIPMAGPANLQGRVVADNIAGRKSTYKGSLGTSIVRCFDLTAAATGASERLLKHLEIKYHKVYTVPPSHATYFPGASLMFIKFMFDDDGKILGAQIVGQDGVDKRIDVLATAIMGGMTVQDLQHLQLAYAPAYGAAKDPINMLGFLASNVLSGDHPSWYPEDIMSLPENALIVDVSSAKEFEELHLKGAINMPWPKMRTQMDQLPSDRPIYFNCHSGFRSYCALCAARQMPHLKDSILKNLTGGLIAFQNFFGVKYTNQDWND